MPSKDPGYEVDPGCADALRNHSVSGSEFSENTQDLGARLSAKINS